MSPRYTLPTDPTAAQTATADRLLARSLLRQVAPWLYDTSLLPPLVVAPKHTTPWTRAVIRNAVAQFVRQQGRVPTQADWDQARTHGLPARRTVQKHYATLDTLYTEVQQWLMIHP